MIFIKLEIFIYKKEILKWKGKGLKFNCNFLTIKKALFLNHV